MENPNTVKVGRTQKISTAQYESLDIWVSFSKEVSPDVTLDEMRRVAEELDKQAEAHIKNKEAEIRTKKGEKVFYECSRCGTKVKEEWADKDGKILCYNCKQTQKEVEAEEKLNLPKE